MIQQDTIVTSRASVTNSRALVTNKQSLNDTTRKISSFKIKNINYEQANYLQKKTDWFSR